MEKNLNNISDENLNNISDNTPGTCMEKIKLDGIDPSLLTDVYRIIDKKSSEIETYLENSDLPSFTTAVHTLKTTCRMIGENALSQRFFELEMIGKSANNDALDKEPENKREIALDKESENKREIALESAKFKTPDVLTEFRGLKKKLEPYISKDEESSSLPYSSQEISSLLKEIQSACDDFDVTLAENASKKLLTYQCDKELYEKLIQLSNLVSDLDYEEAKELAENILGLI